MQALLEKQRQILHRQLTRRSRLRRAIAQLFTPELRDRHRASGTASGYDYETQLAQQAARLEAAVAVEAAEVRRHQQTGDNAALAEALAVLAAARWRTGGQRSAALTAQREALQLTRQLIQQDAGRFTPLLVDRLRCFAEWAEVIGLHTDAEAARTEAAEVEADRRTLP